MKKLIIQLLLIMFSAVLYSQSISIEKCYQMARQNYPLIRQYELIEQSKDYNLANAAKGFFPQLSLNTRISWQSDITKFPDQFMDIMNQMGINGISFPEQDQYRIILELYQTIWDGGIISSQRKMIKAQSEVEKQNLEVNLYSIYNQINQLYFGILLLEEQIIQNELLQKELQRNYDRINSFADYGIANKSDLNKIMVEILSRQQTATEMANSRDAYRMMLSLFTGQELLANIVLERPSGNYNNSGEINRPELNLFEAQLQQLSVQKSGILAKGMPAIGLFAQGAYADPGLNMFKGGFTPYFIGGITFSWNFGRLYTYRDENNNLKVNRTIIELQRETFLFNLNRKIVKENAEIEKIKTLIKSDSDIIALREDIKKMSEVKVQNGTLSINDYLQDIVLADMAKQNKSLHEMQLLMTIWQLKIEKGIY